MIYEEIFEPIDVITIFHNGTIQPLRFKWKNQVYKISRIHSRWFLAGNQGRTHHFTVAAGGPDNFEIVFDSANLSWQLARVALDG